jgi:probable sporulation protein (polysaccharide deacetylase family)
MVYFLYIWHMHGTNNVTIGAWSMKQFEVLLLSGLFIIVMVILQKSESVGLFVQHAKEQSEQSAAVGTVPQAQLTEVELKDLRRQIELEAEKIRKPPIDARVDRVWRAIPGYNGIEVDVEKSFELNQQRWIHDKLRLAIREVTPAIGLEHLGAHPVYKGNPEKPMVSLMINVAWGNEFLPKMLEVLENENVHATFFFDGSWLKQNIPTAQLIKEKGHELSNHAYSHKNMSELSRSQALSEISKTQQLLEQQLQVNNKLFAPPSGDFNQSTVNIARELNLTTILWTLDTVDWQRPTPSSIVKKVKEMVGPGTLILMHPTSSSSQAIQSIIQVIKSKNLHLGTVSEVISSNRMPQVESVNQ